MSSLGVRNKNPGNIRASKVRWVGQLSGELGVNKGMCVFSEMRFGIRALARNLLTYYVAYKLHTVHSIIYRWAPPTENDTDAYIKMVCEVLDVKDKDTLDLFDKPTLIGLATAIIRQENGKAADEITPGMIEIGVNLALEVS